MRHNQAAVGWYIDALNGDSLNINTLYCFNRLTNVEILSMQTTDRNIPTHKHTNTIVFTHNSRLLVLLLKEVAYKCKSSGPTSRVSSSSDGSWGVSLGGGALWV